MSAIVGDSSCIQDPNGGNTKQAGYPCSYFIGVIRDRSCHGYAACNQYGVFYQFHSTNFDLSLKLLFHHHDSTLITFNWKTGYYNTANIGNDSCQLKGK